MIARFILVAAVSLLCSVLTLSAKTDDKKVYSGFSGGMMVHTGYLGGGDNPYDIKPSGLTFGIGGAARVHLWKHFRAGFEGYFSNMGLHDEKVSSGSFNKLFWAGALGDFYWKLGDFYPYVGATVGGGMETAFYMSGDKHDWEPETSATFNKTPFFMVDPFVGVEYAVGKALRLTLKMDFILAFNEGGLNKPLGPRLYFGFIFAH